MIPSFLTYIYIYIVQPKATMVLMGERRAEKRRQPGSREISANNANDQHNIVAERTLDFDTCFKLFIYITLLGPREIERSACP